MFILFILGGNQNRENQNQTWQVKTKPARSKSQPYLVLTLILTWQVLFLTY